MNKKSSAEAKLTMPRHASQKDGGFTLIELMVVTVVIAVLAAIAYPAYTSHIQRTKRTAAQAQMMELAGRQQQYLLNNRAYGSYTDLTGTGYVLPDTVSRTYTVTVDITTTTLPRFTITFTPFGAQGADGALTLTSEGQKGPASKWAQ